MKQARDRLSARGLTVQLRCRSSGGSIAVLTEQKDLRAHEAQQKEGSTDDVRCGLLAVRPCHALPDGGRGNRGRQSSFDCALAASPVFHEVTERYLIWGTGMRRRGESGSSIINKQVAR